jgi:hypothetical protein
VTSVRRFTNIDCARAQVYKEAARVQYSSVLFSSVQFKGPAVVRVEFMVDQVAGADLSAPVCNES